MKKIILFMLASVLCINVFAQDFDITKLRAGGGLVYATDIGNIGINLNAAYSITEEWEGAFAFSHIFRKDYTSFNVIDLDGHYIFHVEDEKLSFYGIGGLGFTFWNVDVPTQTITENVPMFGEMTMEVPGYKDNGSKVGLNIGIGANYKLSETLNLAPEMRYTIMNGGYLRIGASVQYLF
ncbi:outer membrane beta-barrel protein [Saccharicrinis aurantiacus]|uniref:outer membrane beta-barrel protein n=1 Tax=Saccharicrinis aurantiacus TaxID=1849719 RepID=UPI00094FDB40|nr:outer membrane beta-barrel protein [Saccharicrinis aurantiacus]